MSGHLKLLWTATGVVLLMVFTGCAGPRSISRVDPVAVLSQAKQERTSTAFTTASFRVKFSLSTQAGSGAGIAYLYAKKPDTLAIEVPGVFGAGAFRARIDGASHLFIYIPEEKAYYDGLLAQFPAEGIFWTPTVWQSPAWDVFFGNSSPLGGDDDTLTFVGERKGLYFYGEDDQGWQHEIGINPRDGKARQELWITEDSAVIWRIRYGRSRQGKTGPPIDRIDLQTEWGEKFSLQFQEANFDVPISPRKFSTDVPAGARRIEPLR